MPVGTNSRNGNHCPRDAKTNGDEDSSNSDDGSSMYDEEDGDRRKGDCLDDMQYLEQQFSDLKELLYREKAQQLEQKIQMVNEGSAAEYLQPLQELEESFKSRLDTAELQHQCRVGQLNVLDTRNIQNKYEEEVQSAHQDFEEFCRVTMMRMKGEVEEKIRRLQEERVMAELTSESSSRKRRSKVNEFLLPEKRKKPVTVTGPYVVHMLRDMDIMEDLTDIRRARAALEVQRREGKSKTSWR